MKNVKMLKVEFMNLMELVEYLNANETEDNTYFDISKGHQGHVKYTKGGNIEIVGHVTSDFEFLVKVEKEITEKTAFDTLYFTYVQDNELVHEESYNYSVKEAIEFIENELKGKLFSAYAKVNNEMTQVY